MSTIQDFETEEMYDWALVDIVEKPPYSHYDMVVLLARGRFVIEGEVSSMKDAVYYADYHNKSSQVFEALRDLTGNEVKENVY